MFAVCVTFEIKQDVMDRFLPLMRANADTSLRTEPGCHQFDVCTNEASSTVFLYELYSDAAAFQAHLQTAHFQEFDRATAEMISDKSVSTYEGVHQAD